MKHFTTLSDYNYLPLGLSLYESLKKTSKEDFILYYLCLDEKTHDKISEIDEHNIHPISLENLMNENSDLYEYKKAEYREFVWMLASYFTYYILITKKPKNISYIDADIYLYDDIQIMLDKIIIGYSTTTYNGNC